MLRRLFLVFILIPTFALVGCKISGIITHNGAGLEGVTVVLSGDASMSPTTDADGNYVFDGLNQGTYTIAPADAEADVPEPMETEEEAISAEPAPES